MLRVRTGPECPEDNLRELPEIAAQTVGWLERERKERERERENFPGKALI